MKNRSTSKTAPARNALVMSTLTAAIGFALSASAQNSITATTDAAKGRAPVVTIQGITNETAAGETPAPGDVLRVQATSTDADADPITKTDYSWTIDAAEVSAAQTYTVQAADVGDTLKVKVTAHTDATKTDPASGSAETTVIVAGTGTAPTAEDVAITGTPKVGTVLNGIYRFADAETDDESGTTFQWYRADDASGTGAVAIATATAQNYTPVAADEGKFLIFEVTPRADRNPMVGTAKRATTSVATAAFDGSAPTANPVVISGTAKVGEALAGTYTFNDADVGDLESGTTFQWWRAADASGTGKASIAGATTLVYTPVLADEGMFLILEVTPRSATGNPKVGNIASATTSVATAPADGSAPTANPVNIVGTPQVGTQLNATYTFIDVDVGDVESGTTFQWSRATDASGTGKTAISGATAQQYTPVVADQGRFLIIDVTPRSATGNPKVGNVASASTSVAVAAQLGNAPTAEEVGVSGLRQVGATLSGSYRFDDKDVGDLESGTTFQWYRANDADGTAEVAIAGANAQNYTIVAADAGRFLIFEVTPRSATGNPKVGLPGRAATAGTIIVGTAPVAKDVAVTGTTVVGEQLNGIYDFVDPEDPEQGTTFQWYRATDAAGGGAVAIAGATGQAYTLTVADRGRFLAFEVLPRSATGVPNVGNAVRSPYSSAVLGAVGAAPVANGVAVNGTTVVGSQLNGIYSFSDDDNDLEQGTTFQWYRANDAAGTGAVAIASATAQNYTLVPADQGRFVFFEVIPRSATGLPDVGNAVRVGTAVAIDAVTGAAPVATGVAVNGTTQVGSQLSGIYSFGDVDNDLEQGTTFQWYRASDAAGSDAVAIGSATAQNYTLVAADQGRFVFFEVIPRSATGLPNFGDAVRAGTAVAIDAVTGAAPVATGVGINGTTQVGSQLNGIYSFGDVDNDLEQGTTFQWYRASDAAGSDAVAIASATTQNYALVAADQGRFVFFEVIPRSATGLPNFGDAVRVGTAVAIDAVTGSAPAATGVDITGTTQVGSQLNGIYSFGDVDNDLEQGTTFQWYRASDAAGTDAVAIASATAQNYTLVAADQGRFVFFEVIPRSATGLPNFGDAVRAGTVVAIDAVTGTAPVATGVDITGTTQVGSQLNGIYSFGDVDNDLEQGTTFQWYRASDAAGTDAVAIASATAQNYTLVAADQGRFVFFEVIPRSATGLPDVGNAVRVGTAVAIDAVTGAAPIANGVGINGTTQVGSQLNGIYSFSDDDNDLEQGTTFQWYRASDDTGADAVAIAGATSQDYTPVVADEGMFLIFEVTPRSATGLPDIGNAERATTAMAIAPLVGTAPTAVEVEITGTARENEQLEGTYRFEDADVDAEQGTTFQWYRADDALGAGAVAIASATTQAYMLVAADIGKFVIFEVKPRSATGSPKDGDAVRATTGVAVEADGTAPTATELEIAGTLINGSVLDGTYKYDDVETDPEQGTTFQWYRATDAEGTDAVAISGATAQAHTITTEDVGSFLIFEVTPRAANAPLNGAPVRVATAAAVEGLAPVATEVEILGLVKVGSVLEGSYKFQDAENDPEDGTAFQWYRATDSDGTGIEAIPGATAQQYTLNNTEEGMYVFFEVTPRAANAPKSGETVRIATPSEALPLEGAAPVVTGVRVEGSYIFGEPLRVIYDQHDADGDEPAPTFQWYYDDGTFNPPSTIPGTRGTPIVGATSPVFVPTPDIGNHYVYVEVTAGSRTGLPNVGNKITQVITEPFWNGEQWQEFYRIPVLDTREETFWQPRTHARDLVINGDPTVGNELTGAYDYYDSQGRPEDLAKSQRTWFRADSKTGSNSVVVGSGMSYVLQSEDVGKYILLEVRPWPVGNGAAVTKATTSTTLILSQGP